MPHADPLNPIRCEHHFIDLDFSMKTGDWSQEMSVFFTLKMKRGIEKAELFTIYSSQGRILLSVSMEAGHVVISYHEAAAPVRAARLSTSGNAIHFEKIGPALDDDEYVRHFTGVKYFT